MRISGEAATATATASSSSSSSSSSGKCTGPVAVASARDCLPAVPEYRTRSRDPYYSNSTSVPEAVKAQGSIEYYLVTVSSLSLER